MQRKFWWWGAGVLVLLAAAGGAAWWKGTAVPRMDYRTAKIERGSLQAAVAAAGTVNPVTQVQVSSQVSGQVKELLVDFNSEVKQGQLIARLDPEGFEYRVRQADADVEAARATVLTAQANVQSALAQVGRAQLDLQEVERDLKRKQDLVAQNFISPAELDTAQSKSALARESVKAAQAQVDVARAQSRNAEAVVRQREAQLAQARVDLERTRILSPVDGIVIKRSVEVGQTVAASLQAPELFIIARNLQDMQVEAAVDEADIARIRAGQKVGFTIDAFPGRTFEGEVRQVRKAAVSSQNVVTYVAVVGFANPGASVLPGMTANVRVVTDTRDSVLKLPNASLRVRIAGVEPASAASGAASGAAPAPAAAPAAGGGGAGGGGGGPMAAFRQRLIDEVKLTPAQVEKADAVMAGMRPRFAELRNLPEEERGKARDAILAQMRGQIAALLTDEQKPRYQALVAESAGRQPGRGRVHVLGPDGRPVAYAVRLGISDGSTTELLLAPGSPEAAALKEGAEVITAVVTPDSAGAAAPGAARPGGAGSRAPF